MFFKFVVTNCSLRRDSQLRSSKIVAGDRFVPSPCQPLAIHATTLAPASKPHRIEPRARRGKRR
jgi:hypothetical protein